jgi:hypothetical protein
MEEVIEGLLDVDANPLILFFRWVAAAIGVFVGFVGLILPWSRRQAAWGLASMVHRLSRWYGEQGNASDIASVFTGVALYFIGVTPVDATGIPAASISIRNLWRVAEQVKLRLRPSVEAEWAISTGFMFGQMLGRWVAIVDPPTARRRTG